MGELAELVCLKDPGTGYDQEARYDHLLDSKQLVAICPVGCNGQVHAAKASTPQKAATVPWSYPAGLLPLLSYHCLPVVLCCMRTEVRPLAQTTSLKA